MYSKGDLIFENRFEIIKNLSKQGAFADTYLVKDKHRSIEKENCRLIKIQEEIKSLCVLKVYNFKKDNNDLKDIKNIIEYATREIKILLSIRHKQLPVFRGYKIIDKEQEPFRIEIVYDFIEGESLSSIKKEYEADEEKIWYLLENMINIIIYLHENKIYHRDISLNNIIKRTESYGDKLFLIDFGLSKIFADESKIGSEINSIVSRGHGTYIEFINESMKNNPTLLDLAFLGCTCIEAFSGKPLRNTGEGGYNDALSLISSWSHETGKVIDKSLEGVLSKLINGDFANAEEVKEEIKQKKKIYQPKKWKEYHSISVNRYVRNRRLDLLSDSTTMVTSDDQYLILQQQPKNELEIWKLIYTDNMINVTSVLVKKIPYEKFLSLNRVKNSNSSEYIRHLKFIFSVSNTKKIFAITSKSRESEDNIIKLYSLDHLINNDSFEPIIEIKVPDSIEKIIFNPNNDYQLLFFNDLEIFRIDIDQENYEYSINRISDFYTPEYQIPDSSYSIYTYPKNIFFNDDGYKLIVVLETQHPSGERWSSKIMTVGINTTKIETLSTSTIDKRVSCSAINETKGKIAIANRGIIEDESTDTQDFATQIGIYDFNRAEYQRDINEKDGVNSQVTAMCFHPDEPFIVIGDLKGYFIFKNYNNGDTYQRSILKGSEENNQIDFLKFINSGKLLLVGMNDQIKIFKEEDGYEVKK